MDSTCIFKVTIVMAMAACVVHGGVTKPCVDDGYDLRCPSMTKLPSVTSSKRLTVEDNIIDWGQLKRGHESIEAIQGVRPELVCIGKAKESVVVKGTCGNRRAVVVKEEPTGPAFLGGPKLPPINVNVGDSSWGAILGEIIGVAGFVLLWSALTYFRKSVCALCGRNPDGTRIDSANATNANVEELISLGSDALDAGLTAVAQPEVFSLSSIFVQEVESRGEEQGAVDDVAIIDQA